MLRSFFFFFFLAADLPSSFVGPLRWLFLATRELCPAVGADQGSQNTTRVQACTFLEDHGYSMANSCIVRQGRMGVVVSKLVNLLPGRTLHEVLHAIDGGMICITLKSFES